MKGNTMNILKHMEAVFVAAMSIAIGAAYVAETAPEAQAQAPAARANVAVVTVSAKRMSPAEKQQSLKAEQRDEQRDGRI
jgi:hypothetical protein